MIALTFLIYCCYILVVFSYTSYILEASKVKPIIFVSLMLLNIFLVVLPVYVTKFHYEFLIMILYVVALTAETSILCKKNLMKTLFGVFSFAINFFAIRTIIIVSMVLITGDSVATIVASEENRILITSINFLIPIPYILFTRTILKHNVLDIALSETNTTILSTIFLCATFINQMAVFPSLFKTEGFLERNLYYHLATAIFSISVFGLVMAINYIYSNLKVVANTYSKEIEEIQLQKLQIKDLENRSTIDPMTGFFIRDVALKKLEVHVKAKESCFIVFIDIDGLKLVNDCYGHNEGDWYIKAVSEEIKSSLNNHIIARLGGDEFLVVGKKTSPNSIAQAISELEKNISNISSQNSKQYQTTISYGIQEIGPDNCFSAKELVDIADDKMYAFKRSRKRNRV